MLVSLCAEPTTPVFEGDKILQLWKEMHQIISTSWSVPADQYTKCPRVRIGFSLERDMVYVHHYTSSVIIDCETEKTKNNNN